MSPESFKNLWFYTNSAFFINYSLSILKLLVAFPLPVLPSSVNCLLLFVSYALTFRGFLPHLKSQEINTIAKKIFTHPNMFCIFLFLCFVPNILLLPFYLLTVYHMVTSIVARKETFQFYFFYNFVVFLNTNISAIGKAALVLEIGLFPVACIMMVMRRIGLLTLLAYGLMLRQQYSQSASMKEVAMESVQQLHGLFMKMPEGVRMRFLKVTGYLGAAVGREKEIKKKQ